MGLSPKNHEVLCMVMLGVGTIFTFAGYVVQAFLSENVLHILHKLHPDRISMYDGYYGVAVHYCTFAIGSLITPVLCNYVSSKFLLSMTAVLMCFFFVGFIYVHYIYFYFSQVLLGFAYAVYNTGEGLYFSEHSSKKTIQANSMIETAVGHSSTFWAGLALMGIMAAITGGSTTNEYSFTEEQIRILYFTMLAITLIGFAIFLALPTKQYDSLAKEHAAPRQPFRKQLATLLGTFRHKETLYLLPTSVHMGLYVAFYMSIYPTALQFSELTAGDVYMIAIFSMGLGIGETLGGIILGPITKRVGKHGQKVLLLFHIFAVAAVLALCQCTVPNYAPIHPTGVVEMLINPSRLTTISVGILCGMMDFAWTAARIMFCQQSIPSKRSQLFAITRIYQCGTAGLILFISPLMTINVWCVVLSTSLLIAIVFFILLDKRLVKSYKLDNAMVYPVEVEVYPAEEDVVKSIDESMSS